MNPTRQEKKSVPLSYLGLGRQGWRVETDNQFRNNQEFHVFLNDEPRGVVIRVPHAMRSTRWSWNGKLYRTLSDAVVAIRGTK